MLITIALKEAQTVYFVINQLLNDIINIYLKVLLFTHFQAYTLRHKWRKIKAKYQANYDNITGLQHAMTFSERG